MDGKQAIIKQGCLSASSGPQDRSWQKKYYVLFSSTENNRARLDWFSDKDAFQKSPTVRKTIFIEEIKNIEATKLPGYNYVFQIETLRRLEPFMFSAQSQREMTDWMSHIKKVVSSAKKGQPSKQPQGGESHLGQDIYNNALWGFDEKPAEFEVQIGETETAKLCNLHNTKCILQIFANCMSLKHHENRSNDSLSFVWPYKYIRRYGRSRNSFTFESGRRCSSGEGVFILLTSQAEELFRAVQRANASSQETEEPSQPSIPTRNYKTEAGKGDDCYDSIQGDDYQHLEAQPVTPNPDYIKPNKPPAGTTRGATAPIFPPEQSKPRQAQPLPPKPVLTKSDSKPLEETYSSVTDNVRAGIRQVAEGAEEYGYTNPVIGEGGSAVSAAVAQVQAQKGLEPVEPDMTEYDEVTLNVMKRQPTTGPVPEVYGHLYGEAQNTRTKVVGVSDTDIYQEVMPT